MAHTPGPWRVGPVDDTVVTAADGSEVAAIDGDYNQPELWPVMEANARLIAAAPDLLEAMKASIALADQNAAVFGGKPVRTAECQALYERCAEIVAKAEGRS